MLIDFLITTLLEHQASQESPKTPKKSPKTAPDSLQEPLKKKSKCELSLQQKVAPEIALKVVHTGFKICPTNHAKNNPNLTRF